jgi:hypothetical protein
MKKLLIILLSIIGCSKPKSDIYVVKAGNHHASNRRLVILKSPQLRFTFTVNDTWKWKDGLDLSKVAGMCWGDPKKNSIRLAVRSTKDGSRLYAFAHIDGKIRIEPICTVQNGMHECSITYHTDTFIVIVDGFYALINTKAGLGRRPELCWPYIGGDYVLDHDWIIRLEFE